MQATNMSRNQLRSRLQEALPELAAPRLRLTDPTIPPVTRGTTSMEIHRQEPTPIPKREQQTVGPVGGAVFPPPATKRVIINDNGTLNYYLIPATFDSAV